MIYQTHPLDQARSINKPYVYWHVREVHENMIKEAIKRKTSIEWDISYDDETKKPFIGHPEVFYTVEEKMPLPNNIDIDKAVEMVKNIDELLIVLDCKDERVLPVLKNIIKTLGPNRIIMHSFIKEWGIPYPADIHQEAHWPVEDVPFEAIRKFIKETKVMAIGSIHAISAERLKNEKLLDRALASAKGIFQSLSIYLPNVPIPPMDEVQRIVVAGYLPWLNYDLLYDKESLGFPYLGMTDFPERATVTPDLYK